jgi:hypothetical protein
LKLGIELVDRVGRRSVHAEPAAQAYFCDHIAAMAECEYRIPDAEFGCKRGWHRWTPFH